MNTIKPYLIFSVDRDDRTDDENRTAQKLIEQVLKMSSTPYKTVRGVYRGGSEQAYMVAWTPQTEREIVQHACQINNQECYLGCDTNRRGSYYDRNGQYLDTVGTQRVTDTQPAGDHTDLMNGEYVYFD